MSILWVGTHKFNYHLSIGESDIARDELKHAMHFINLARKEAITPEQKLYVGDLQARYDLMATA